ncbi:MAG TPA: glycosyltransferase family A protein [Acidimicrobiales bacterium]|nr:glycosyltransferase family A protein [Acidimicrobiales bacterium]
MTPAACVVVATRGRSERLARLIGALEAQRAPWPFEVVVVDDASPDGTWEQLQRLAEASSVPVRAVRRAVHGGAAAARNVGWRAASAPIVAFTDDDCAPQPDWLTRLVERCQAGADLVQGRTEADPAQLGAMGPFGRTVECREEGLYPTCNVAYRRQLLEELGGFDESFRRSCEDTDLAWRAREAGARAAYASDAVVFHDVHPSSYVSYLREKLRWVDEPRLVRRHPGLRQGQLHQRYVWRASHPRAVVAGAGLLLAGSAVSKPICRRARVAVGLALTAPYLRFRTYHDPLRCGPRRRWLLMGPALFADLFEVAITVAGAVRHRTPLL